MKKIICSLLAILMLVSLCACGSVDDSSDIRGEIIGGNIVPETTDPVETDPVETDPPETESSFSFGKSTGNTYQNDFLGLSCTLPEDWTFYSDQQILEMNNLVGEYLDENAAKQLENASIIYDMMALKQEDGSNISVNLEKLTALQLLSLDIKAVLEAQIDIIVSTYENMGYTDVQVVSEKVTVDGEEYDSLCISAKIQGIDFYSTAFAFLKGNYLANITVSSLVEDNTATYLSYLKID